MLSAARMHTVLDTAQDAFVSMDQDGKVTTWNEAAERLFGWSAAVLFEVLRKTLDHLADVKAPGFSWS